MARIDQNQANAVRAALGTAALCVSDTSMAAHALVARRGFDFASAVHVERRNDGSAAQVDKHRVYISALTAQRAAPVLDAGPDPWSAAPSGRCPAWACERENFLVRRRAKERGMLQVGGILRMQIPFAHARVRNGEVALSLRVGAERVGQVNPKRDLCDVARSARHPAAPPGLAGTGLPARQISGRPATSAPRSGQSRSVRRPPRRA